MKKSLKTLTTILSAITLILNLSPVKAIRGQNPSCSKRTQSGKKAPEEVREKKRQRMAEEHPAHEENQQRGLAARSSQTQKHINPSEKTSGEVQEKNPQRMTEEHPAHERGRQKKSVIWSNQSQGQLNQEQEQQKLLETLQAREKERQMRIVEAQQKLLEIIQAQEKEQQIQAVEAQRRTQAVELRQKIKEWKAREREKIIHYLEEIKNISDVSLSYPFHFVLHISREPIISEELESIIKKIRQQTQSFEKQLISLTQGMYNFEEFRALAFVHALKYLNDNNKLTFPQPVFIQFLHFFYPEISEIPESDCITVTYYRGKLTIRFSFESIVTRVFTLTVY